MPINKQSILLIGLVNNVPIRVINTAYQNLTGCLIIVVCSISCSTSNIGDGAMAQARISFFPPPAGLEQEVGIQDTTLVANLAHTFSLVFFVRPGEYYGVYSAVTAGGTVAISEWSELTLIAPFSAGF